MQQFLVKTISYPISPAHSEECIQIQDVEKPVNRPNYSTDDIYNHLYGDLAGSDYKKLLPVVLALQHEWVSAKRSWHSPKTKKLNVFIKACNLLDPDPSALPSFGLYSPIKLYKNVFSEREYKISKAIKREIDIMVKELGDHKLKFSDMCDYVLKNLNYSKYA